MKTMGKPSSTRLSRASSHSSKKLKTSISTPKMEVHKKKRQRRTKKNIKKLFQKLKNESQSSSVSDISQDTVILLDSSANDTTETHNTVLQRKRTSPCLSPCNSKKQKLNDSSLIIINDDKPNSNISPRQSRNINCSTPITKRDSVSMKQMIIRNFSPNNTNNQNTEIINLTTDNNTTKEINKDSYLTIDLTEDSEINRTGTSVSQRNVNRLGSQDCTFVSASDASLSMSGDSDITVLQNKKSSKNKNIQKYANGIAKLNASEKNKLLMLITKKILGGCNVPDDIKDELGQVRTSVSRAVETVEDTYIREVILGESKTKVGPTKSRNSIGSNIYNPTAEQNRTGLRMIVIDGSNVAMEHTKGSSFSVKGLKICIDYFVKRGHVVKAFVPRFRCKYGKCSDPRMLDALERQGLVIYTPSREIRGRMCNSYDDRYIVQCAAQFDGVIVSGDNYRDLLLENPRWRFIIENRLLQFTWVDDMIMFPRDPLGRYGPTLEQFLKHNNENTPAVPSGRPLNYDL